VAGFTLAGGYAFPFGSLVLTPIARFLYQHTGVDAFTEGGAQGADLAFGSSSVNTVLTFLGADAQYTIPTSFGPLYPIARFHWAHQYSPGNTSVSVAYSNDTRTSFELHFTRGPDLKKLFRPWSGRLAAAFGKRFGLYQL
jgi:outer membrane autotransporter protein